MPDRLRRAVLEHITHGETPRIKDALSTYAKAVRIMRRRIQEAAAR